MGGRFGDDTIREVRERASLTEVISDTVTLRRRGRGAVGLCPFHAEKTPSFTVSEERGFFHCFGCGEHGDVFAFVMKTESLSFPEAVRQIAQRFGIRLPEPVGGSDGGAEPLVAANAIAAAFYQNELAGPGGARARAYLAERGVSDESVGRFGLGYAPGTGDALVRHLRARRVRIEDALTLGLVARRDRPDGSVGFYDRLRDRLVFPITDAGGKVVAFGGRVLPGHPVTGDPPPKYLNSPESRLFHKGHMVYGLAQAREAIRRTARVVVVEGYLDVIALAQAGIGEVVAPLGTALTVDQLRVLRRLRPDAIIACFDGDAAGRRAAARSLPVFLEAGLWGRGVFLPAGEDPDTWVRAHGAESFTALLADAEPLVEVYLTELAGPTRDAVGRNAEAAKEIARMLRRVRNPFEFNLLAKLAAERLGVREEVLRVEGVAPAQGAGAATPESSGHAPGVEELLVEFMATDAAVASRVRDRDLIAEFEHPVWRRTAEQIAAAGESDDRTAVLQALPRDLRDRVVRRLLGEIADEDRQQAVADCIERIELKRQRRTRGLLLEELRSAEARGDAARADAVTRQLQEMDTERTQKIRT